MSDKTFIEESYRAATGVYPPADAFGCVECRAYRHEPKGEGKAQRFCECSNHLPKLATAHQAMKALGHAALNGHSCQSCGDTSPPMKGCDHPMGCGQWQMWLGMVVVRSGMAGEFTRDDGESLENDEVDAWAREE